MKKLFLYLCFAVFLHPEFEIYPYRLDFYEAKQMSSISRPAIDSSNGIKMGEIIEEVRFTTAGISSSSDSVELFL